MSIPARFGWFLAVSVCLLFAATGALAQDEDFASLSESQLQLNEEGSEAFKKGNYDEAVRRFEASLLVGELNITYLNLGRAYFKIGDCKKARNWFAANGVPFVGKDIEKDRAANSEYQRVGRGYSGVPLITVNGSVIRGFDVRAVQREIRRVRADAEPG